jgi:two-component sensor histidine kinase/PAS domain-containing protein
MSLHEDEEHWLLRRQLHEHSGDAVSGAFAKAVNRAYRVFDDNYLRIKLILRRKIYQLVDSNAQLQVLLAERNSRIDSNEERLKKLVYNLNRSEVIAHLGSFTWYKGSMEAEYSDNLLKLLSFDSAENSVLSMIRKFEYPLQILRALRSANRSSSVVKLANLKLKGESRYFDLEAHVTFTGGGTIDIISGIIKENTRWVHVNNRAEDQKKFYEAILNNIPVDIAIFNYDHKYMYLNPVAVRDQEVREFLLGRDDFDYCKFRNLDTTKAEIRRVIFNRARDTKEVVEFEDLSINPDGTNRYMLRRYFPVLNSSGEFTFMLGYGVDITKMKGQELTLEHSLHEKELLLGEIHHSVKNNLTLIVALLEINSAHEKDDLVKKYFNEIRNRISAMALIYDKLYRSEVFNLINLREYITALTNSLQQSFLQGRRDVIELDVDEVYVDNKVAVPLALLINELLSNAFVHAFPKTEFPRLRLTFKRESELLIRLTISDNGPGLPEETDLSKGRTFGFKLISLFARQLKGKLSAFNNNGLRVEVSFENLKHEVRN